MTYDNYATGMEIIFTELFIKNLFFDNIFIFFIFIIMDDDGAK